MGWRMDEAMAKPLGRDRCRKCGNPDVGVVQGPEHPEIAVHYARQRRCLGSGAPAIGFLMRRVAQLEAEVRMASSEWSVGTPADFDPVTHATISRGVWCKYCNAEGPSEGDVVHKPDCLTIKYPPPKKT